MTPYYSDDSVTLWHGDCLDVLATLAGDSVDAVVTDPPYGLGFMGKAWDSTFTPGDSPMRRHAALDAVNAGASRQGGRQRAGADYQRRQASDARSYQEWCERWATECLRVLKPGGHLLAFGGTRTAHRLTSAIEDAGFEIRHRTRSRLPAADRRATVEAHRTRPRLRGRVVTSSRLSLATTDNGGTK